MIDESDSIKHCNNKERRSNTEGLPTEDTRCNGVMQDMNSFSVCVCVCAHDMWQILWVILIFTDYKGTTGWNSQLINNTTLYETKYQCWQNISYCLDHCRTTTVLRHLAIALTTTTVTTKTSCQGGKQTGHTASCCPPVSHFEYIGYWTFASIYPSKVLPFTWRDPRWYWIKQHQDWLVQTFFGGMHGREQQTDRPT